MFNQPVSTDNDDAACAGLYSRVAALRGLGQPAHTRVHYGYETVFVVVLVVVCGLSVFVGLAEPLGSFAHDTFFLLGNAYRVAQGQVPSRDFSSAWGPVIFLIEAAGLRLAGMRPAGIGYANALFGGLIAVWAFLIVRSRWSSATACAAGIFTLCLITAPFPLGHLPFDFGYSMIYNRYGYAFFGVIVLECSTVALASGTWPCKGIGSPWSTGIALGLLALLKISYAMVAVPFVALPLIVNPCSAKRRLIGLCSGFAAIAFLEAIYLKFDLWDMLRDLEMAAVSRNLSLRIIHAVGVSDSLRGAAIVAGSLLLCRADWYRFRNPIARVRWLLFGLLTVASGYLLLISNQQAGSFPLNGYAAVMLAAAYPQQIENETNKPKLSPQLMPALLLAFCILPLCLASTISLARAAEIRQWPQMVSGVTLGAPARDASFVFRRTVGPVKTAIAGAEYVAAVDDGLALLHRHLPDDAGVLAFDEFNPFNYLMNRPTPRGGIAAAAFDYVFCDAAHPSPKRFFGNTHFVIVRKYHNPLNVIERADVAALIRIYGPTLRKDFARVGETRHWVLWRRIKDATAPPAKRTMQPSSGR